MKKFFALVLAVAMIMSMSAVSFAADVESKLELIGPMDYDADNDLMRLTGLKFGDTVYYAIVIDDELVSNYEAVEKLKIKTSFEMGEDLVESVEIVKKAAAKSVMKTVKEDGEEKQVEQVNPAFAEKFEDDVTYDYFYFVGVKTVAKETVSEGDIIGTFEFNRSDIEDLFDGEGYDDDEVEEGVQEGEIDEVEVDFEIGIFYDANDYVGDSKDYKGATLNNINGDINLDWDEPYALKFDCDDEIEIAFGTEENEGTFTVDVSGQGKVYIKWNTKADEAVVAANPGVKMHFVNFNNVKWNRTGEFVYEMEDIAAAYKVVDGALVEIAGLEVDDDEVTFNTRVLGNYVFADAELVNPVVAAPEVEAVAPVVTNPTTGA